MSYRSQYSGNNASSLMDVFLLQQKNSVYKDFDPKKMSSKQRAGLRTDVNSGYRQYTARNGKSQTNYAYYKNHAGWSAIADEIGIKKINSENDISRMYDYTNGYNSGGSGGGGGSSYTPYMQSSPSQQLAPINGPGALTQTPVAPPAPPPPPPATTNQNTNITNGTLSIGSAESTAKKKNNLNKGTSQFKRNLKIMNVNP